MKKEKLYRIKPLEWKDYKQSTVVSYCKHYQIAHNSGSFDVWDRDTCAWTGICKITLEAAKAAAQNHYEQRVKECLIEVKP